MSSYVDKSHNVTVLLYHLVFPAKYRRAVIDVSVDQALREVCLEIEARYQFKFLEIGTDRDHVHFLVQSVPTYSVTRLVTLIKSLTAREIFRRCGGVKKRLWGGEFWSDGYFASTVGRQGWVKERGLYFASGWDTAYRPLLAMADQDEPPLAGGLLTARIGRGRHSHTALNLFHQMDNLVPGAFRLMANLVAPAG